MWEDLTFTLGVVGFVWAVGLSLLELFAVLGLWVGLPSGIRPHGHL